MKGRGLMREEIARQDRMTERLRAYREALETVERLGKEGDPKSRYVASRNLARAHTVAFDALQKGAQ